MRRDRLRKHPGAGLVVAVLTVATPVPVGAEETRLAPFAFEDVDFGPDCTPNAAFGRVKTLLVPGRSVDADAEPATDTPLYDATPGAVLHTLQIGRVIDWHGLHLVEVRFHHGVESGPTNHSLVFADSPERVRAVWSARGWDLPPAGQTRVIDDEAIAVAVGIERHGELVAVTCFSD